VCIILFNYDSFHNFYLFCYVHNVLSSFSSRVLCPTLSDFTISSVSCLFRYLRLISYAAVLIGRITDLARPFVRPTVCPVRALNSITKRRTKTKICVNLFQRRSKPVCLFLAL